MSSREKIKKSKKHKKIVETKSLHLLHLLPSAAAVACGHYLAAQLAHGSAVASASSHAAGSKAAGREAVGALDSVLCRALSGDGIGLPAREVVISERGSFHRQ